MKEKIKELYVGQEFKSYRAVCEFLDEKTKGGDSKKSQISDWKQYFNWENKGHKWIVIKIHDEIIPKTDNRGKHNNHFNPNSLYSNHMDTLVLDMLQKQNNIDETFTRIVCNNIPIFSNNYFEMRRSQSVTRDMSDKYNLTNTNITTIYTSVIEDKVKGAFTSSLNRLQNKGYITYNLSTNVIYDGLIYDGQGYVKATKATLEDLELITDAEDKAREVQGFRKGARLTKKEVKQLQNKTDYFLQDTHISRIWLSYEINLINHNLDRVAPDEVTQALEKITKAFIISTHKSMDNMSNKNKIEKEYAFGVKQPLHYWNRNKEAISQILTLDSLMFRNYIEFIDEENARYTVHQDKSYFDSAVDEVIDEIWGDICPF